MYVTSSPLKHNLSCHIYYLVYTISCFVICIHATADIYKPQENLVFSNEVGSTKESIALLT